MKFGLFYELQLPKPLDSDQWHPDDERRLVLETLKQIEFADKLGFDCVFEVEHDFLEEYAHSSAPESCSQQRASVPGISGWATASSRCRRCSTTRSAWPSASPRWTWSPMVGWSSAPARAATPRTLALALTCPARRPCGKRQRARA